MICVLIGIALLFSLPFVDGKPEGKRGKAAVAAVWAFLLYAVVMTVWSLA